MVKFRTATALVDVTPYVRTLTGLIQCDEAIFFTLAGPQPSGTPVAVLSAVATPDTVYGAASRPGTVTVTTNQTSVAVAGGKPPYTYVWSAAAGLTATSPNTAATAFRGNVNSGDTIEGDCVCTVTDAAGAVVASNAVYASASNYGRDLR